MTLPNKLTLIRIVMIPVLLYLYYSSDYEWFPLGFLLGVFVGTTDYLDGYFGSKVRSGVCFG